MYKDQYCSFHPHKTIMLHDNPLKSSLYSTETLATNRITKGDSFTIKGRQVKTRQLSVYEIEMELIP